MDLRARHPIPPFQNDVPHFGFRFSTGKGVSFWPADVSMLIRGVRQAARRRSDFFEMIQRLR